MKKTAILFALLALIFLPVVADVPPDPGYVRQSANLVLETSDDLSGYRFFLESPMKVEEIKIVAGTPTLVSASGRAGAMRIGRLFAIPGREYEQFASRLTEEEFKQALREKKLFTSTELLSHNFVTTIPVGARFEDPVYRIEKDGETGLRAVQISGGARGGQSISFGIHTVSRSWNPVVIAIISGLFLYLGIAILGIWYFRRSSKHP
ncbi:MAG TPA: hypothetical protein VJ781_01745 [Pyrinomonadaceae bacterium]|nr:hypothetical protein [Pyrinomonadaceae bacterium]